MRNPFLFLLLASIVCFGAAAAPRDAHAVIGIVDIEIEVPSLVEKIVELLKEPLFQAFAQRIVDFYVDQTIQMIQNFEFGGGPNQITDYYKDTFGEAAGAAIGDVIVGLGADKLCSPIDWNFQLQLQLAPPQTFSDRITCTLGDVLQNVEGGFGLEGFLNDFTAGGWLAYTTSLEPQNNLLGVQFIAFDEFLRKKGERVENAKYEATTGGGILGFRNCLEWKCVGGGYETAGMPPNTCAVKDDGGVFLSWANKGDSTNNGDENSDEQYKKRSPDNYPFNGKNAKPGSSGWICAEQETVTPGKMVSDGLTEALNIGQNQIVNADGFSDMLAAILNALANKAIQISSDGLLRGVRGSTEVGSCAELDGNTAAGTTLIRATCEITNVFRNLGSAILAPFKRIVSTKALEGVQTCLSEAATNALVTRIPGSAVGACAEQAISVAQSETAEAGKDTGVACIAGVAAEEHVTAVQALECAGSIIADQKKGPLKILITIIRTLTFFSPADVAGALAQAGAPEEMKAATMCLAENNLSLGCIAKSRAEYCVNQAVDANSVDKANECVANTVLKYDCLPSATGVQCLFDAGIKGDFDEIEDTINEASSTLNTLATSTFNALATSTTP